MISYEPFDRTLYRKNSTEDVYKRQSLLSRAVYTVVGIAALCAIPSLFGSEPQARRAE